MSRPIRGYIKRGSCVAYDIRLCNSVDFGERYGVGNLIYRVSSYAVVGIRESSVVTLYAMSVRRDIMVIGC